MCYITQKGLTRLNTHTEIWHHLSKWRCNQYSMGWVHMRILEWTHRHTHSTKAPAPQVKPHAKTPWETSVSPALGGKVGGGGMCQRLFTYIANPSARLCKVTESLSKNEKKQITKGAEKRDRLQEEGKRLYLFVLCCKDPRWSCKLSLADWTAARANPSFLFWRYYATGSLSQVELICPQETHSFIHFTIKQSRFSKSSIVESLPISLP